MVLAEFCDRACVTSVDVAEEFLGLSVKLLEIRTDGQATVGHDEPPRTSPWSAGAGQRRFGDHIRTSHNLVRWTRSCPRTGGVLHAWLKRNTEPGSQTSSDASALFLVKAVERYRPRFAAIARRLERLPHAAVRQWAPRDTGQPDRSQRIGMRAQDHRAVVDAAAQGDRV